MNVSEDFSKMFCPGSKPARQDLLSSPPLQEICELLTNQVERVENTLKDRLQEESPIGYTTSKGLRLLKVNEFLSFCLYHEGMHFEKIKLIKKLVGSLDNNEKNGSSTR